MADLPDVVAEIESVASGNPLVVRTSGVHGLKDQDEVKITGVEGIPGANGSFFVKVSGYEAQLFALYSDAQLTVAASAPGKYDKGGTVYFPFPDDYAIVMGINRYPAFKALQGPEADAVRFRAWLISVTGGMMRTDRVRMILSSDPAYRTANAGSVYDARPALNDFGTEFNRLRDMAYTAKKPANRVGRRLYLFFSGHGITPARAPSPDLDDAALLMANASNTALDQHLPGHPYAEWFRNAAAFDEIVLIMDCCRDLKNNVSTIGPTPPLLNDRKDAVRRFYAAATELDSKSWEQQFGGSYHGVFSYALMEALASDTVCDAQGRLTGSRLKNYLETRIRELRKDQIPRVFPPPDPQNDIVFRPRRTSFKPNVRITFGPGLEGKQVQLIGRNYPLPEESHVIDGKPWELSLSNGLYKLQIPGGQEGAAWEFKGNEVMKSVQFP